MNFTRKITTLNINSIECDVKKSLLKDFIQNNDLDIIFLQEVSFLNFSFIQSHQTVLNVSERGRGTAILIRNGIEYSDIHMSECGRILSIVVNGVNLICIYAKSGSNYTQERNSFFMNDIGTHFTKRGITETIVGGDFNCVLDSADSRNGSRNFCFGLAQMVQIMSLRDCLTNRNSEKKFTFFRGTSASRLDRFYVSNGILSNIINTETTPTSFSDHHAFTMKIKIDQSQITVRHGFGYWKINPTFFKNEDIMNRYSEKIRQIKQFQSYERNFVDWWINSFKKNSKYFFKNEAIQFNRTISEEKGIYYRALLQLSERQNRGQDVQAELCFTKTRLMIIERQKIESLRNKFKPNTVCEDEKINIFQIFAREKYRSPISKLKVGDRTLTNQNEIKLAVQSHFAQTFNEHSENPLPSYSTVENLQSSLDAEEADELLRPITQEEIRKTLMSCTRKKSPGPDGLSYEFYIKNFDAIKDDLVKLYNSFFENPSTISSPFLDGIITLIPKSPKIETISDLRPISLLNTDYKLFTKILAARIQKVLPEIIGKGQTACLADASCIENLIDLRNLVCASKMSLRLKFAIMSIDLEKAFDRVRQKYLWKCLEKFGFPRQFIEIIRRLYQRASSKILINGFLTDDVHIQRSVRQGCPLSMILFVMYIEPLIRMMSAALEGIQVGNDFIRTIGYADDLNFIIKSNLEADRIFEIISVYCEESGAKINLNKSAFLRINECKIGPQLIAETEKLKILGFFFCKKLRDLVNANYDKLIQTINFLINQNSRRNLNLIQKIWVANTFMLSKLWYYSQVVPPENVHIGKVKKAIGKFLWTGHLYKIDRRQIILPYQKGGLNLVSIPEKTRALFLKRNLFKITDGFHGERNDFLFVERQNLDLLRNTREALVAAPIILERGLITSKMIYKYLLEQQNFNIYIQTKFPSINFSICWENLRENHVPSDWKSTTYLVINDIIPNRVKLRRHRINEEDPVCLKCQTIDDNVHRIKKCPAAKQVWDWVHNKLTYNLSISVEDPEELISRKLNRTEKAGLWLVMAAIHYNIFNYLDGSLESFKNMIRTSRWKDKAKIEKKFGNLLNIF
jgi:exonuclease III